MNARKKKKSLICNSYLDHKCFLSEPKQTKQTWLENHKINPYRTFTNSIAF